LGISHNALARFFRRESAANILVRSLDFFRQQVENDTAIYKLINHADNQLDKRIVTLEESLKNRQKIQIQQFREIVSSYSGSISNQTGITFEWSDECILKLIDSNLPFKSLKPFIEKTLTVLINREFTTPSIIKIKATDLVLEDYEQKPNEKPVISIRYERTLMLLDRYEDSAKKVTQAKLSLTGVNLGKYCDPPVSPAAISDALKKHSKKITTLFAKYPNRWSLIRQEFRPVKNLVYRTGLLKIKAS